MRLVRMDLQGQVGVRSGGLCMVGRSINYG